MNGRAVNFVLFLRKCFCVWWRTRWRKGIAWVPQQYRKYLRRGCRRERHKGSQTKNKLTVCRVAIQISLLMCKSLAITIIHSQSTLFQLSAMFFKYTCRHIHTLRSLNFFHRRWTKSRFLPQENLLSLLNYNRHLKKGWQICFWMEVIHTHQKYQ